MKDKWILDIDADTRTILAAAIDNDNKITRSIRLRGTEAHALVLALGDVMSLMNRQQIAAIEDPQERRRMEALQDMIDKMKPAQ